MNKKQRWIALLLLTTWVTSMAGCITIKVVGKEIYEVP
jgi:hypothetical protein